MAEEVSNEAYYGAMKLMFASDGWTYLMEDMLDQANHINDLQLCKDPDDLRFRQGQLNVLGGLLNLEDTTRRSEEDAQAEEVANMGPPV